MICGDLSCGFRYVLVVDRQRQTTLARWCVPPAPIPQHGFSENCFHMGPPNGFPAAGPFSHDCKLGKCTVKATKRKWEVGMGHHKRTMRSSHVSVPKRTPNNYSKIVARSFQRHVKNHSGLECCTDKNAQLHAEQTHSAEQVTRCVLNDRGHHRGLEQLNQNIDARKTKEGETQTRWADRTRTCTGSYHCDSCPNALLGAHGASVRRGKQPDGINGKGGAERLPVQWKGTDTSTR